MNTTHKLIILGLIIFTITAAVFFKTAEKTEAPANISDEIVEVDEVDVDVVFNITGINFAFDIEELRVTEGDVVTVNFESIEGFHDWVVDEFDAKTERVKSGGKTSVTFVAEAAGTYEYYCSIGSHRVKGMVGNLIVEPLTAE